MKVIFLPAAAFVILAGCSSAPPPVVDNRAADARAIQAVEETAGKGWDARNADQIGSVYAADAQLMIPNMPTIKGSEVAAGMKEMFKDPNLSLKFVNIKTEVAKSGELGYTQGTYVLTSTDPKTKRILTEKGRYVTTFAKQTDGSWKVMDDINTMDGPATSAAAPAGLKSKAAANTKKKQTKKKK